MAKKAAAPKETTGKFLVRAFITDVESKRGSKKLPKVVRVNSVADGVIAAQGAVDALGDKASMLVKLEIYPEPIPTAGETFE